MVLVELMAGSLVMGLGTVLAAVGYNAYRASGVRQLLLTAAAFAVAACGGLVLVASILVYGQAGPTGISLFASFMAACLVIFYLALFARTE